MAAFRNRPLEKTYPVYEKIRYDRHVKNMAVLVVIGVDENGRRDILAIEPMQEESKETYSELFENLKARGLKNIFMPVLFDVLFLFLLLSIFFYCLSGFQTNRAYLDVNQNPYIN